MTIKVFIYIIVSIFLSASAQIALKLGMMKYKLHAIHAETLIQKIWLITSNFYVLTGVCLYVIGMIVWLAVLIHIDVSKAYPFVGLGFIFTMVLAYFILGEQISLIRMIGVAQIILGVILISRS